MPQKRPAQIMEAALGVFARRGFSAATLDEIAGRAGVTKGTIYRYFSDKETLFIETLRWKIGGAIGGLDMPKGQESAEMLVERVVRSALSLFHEREFLSVVALLVGEANRFPTVAKRYYRDVILVMNRAIAQAVSVLAERGKLRADLDPLIVGRALVGMVMVFGLSQELLRGKEILPISERDIARTVISLALDGLRGREGRAGG